MSLFNFELISSENECLPPADDIQKINKVVKPAVFALICNLCKESGFAGEEAKRKGGERK